MQQRLFVVCRTLLCVTLGRTAFEEAGLHACIINKTISLLGLVFENSKVVW